MNQKQQRDFNQSLLAPIKEAILRTQQEIMELESRIRLHGVRSRLFEDPQWKAVFDELRALESFSTGQLLRQRLDDYRQGYHQGILYAMAMLLRPPFVDEAAFTVAVTETLPGLRQDLEAHKRLLGPRQSEQP